MPKLHVTTTEVVDINNGGRPLNVAWDAALSLSREYSNYDGDGKYTHARVTVVDPATKSKTVFLYTED